MEGHTYQNKFKGLDSNHLSGPNIHDTEKIVMTKNADGKVKKNLVIETVATITTSAGQAGHIANENYERPKNKSIKKEV